MQRDKNDVCVRGQLQLTGSRIDLVNLMAQERNALATAAPLLSEISRSADGPPSRTVMFNRSNLSFIENFQTEPPRFRSP
jgi:hypothetical protein